MKITAIDSFVLSIPTAKPIALDFPEHRLVVANIHTDQGISGLGYSLAFVGGGSEAIQVYLETRLKPLLLGEDPLFVERLWERMYRADRGIKRQGVAAYALSALDIGLWDLAGKAARLPLYKLWGAVTGEVPAYGSGGWPNYSVSDLVGEAERYAAMGCRYYKMKIHHPDPRVNRERVEAVRKALGSGVRLMVDVNQRLDVLANIRQARLLEEAVKGQVTVLAEFGHHLWPLARNLTLDVLKHDRLGLPVHDDLATRGQERESALDLAFQALAGQTGDCTKLAVPGELLVLVTDEVEHRQDGLVAGAT